MSSSEHEAWFDRFADGMKKHEDGRTSVPLEGADLGRYRLETPLGEGSFAVVFRAQDKELNRTVAVKVLKEFAAIDSTLQKRFFREAQFVARISHPNVVTVHDIGTHENTSYLVMEFVNGPSLSSALQNNTLDRKEKVEIIEKVARGLEAAHEEGIVHRDLKPANILMTREGIPKVADFGLAHVRGPETRLTRSGATLGTPAYMAPEQVRGETNAISPKTDVYALGVVLYEMITGRYAYMGNTPVELYGKIIKEDPEPPRKIKSDISPDLETICLKAMEKNIHRRYDSAREFADDLVRYKNGEPIFARPPSTIYKIRRVLWRRKLITLPILAASAVLIVALAVLLPQLEKASEENRITKQKELAEKIEDEKLGRARLKVTQARKIRIDIDRELTKMEIDSPSILRNWERAEELLEDAIEITPKCADAYFELGQLYDILGSDVKKCEKYYSEAIKINLNFFAAYLERIQALLQIYVHIRFDGDGKSVPQTKQSAALLERIQADVVQIRNLPIQENLQFAEGMLLFTQLEYDAAAKTLREYAENRGFDFRAWKWLARVEIAKGNPDEALAAIKRGLKHRALSPQLLTIQIFARNIKAKRLQEKGENEKAALLWKANRIDAETICRAGPDLLRDPVAFNNLGYCRRRAGDLQGALDAYTDSLEIDPSRKGTRRDMGNVYFMLGEWDEAIREYSEEIRNSPDNGGTYFNRALVWREKRELEPMRKDLDQAVKLSPGLASAWQLRGNIRELFQNDPAGALEDYRQALKEGGKNWRSRKIVEEKIEALKKRLEEK